MKFISKLSAVCIAGIPALLCLSASPAASQPDSSAAEKTYTYRSQHITQAADNAIAHLKEMQKNKRKFSAKDEAWLQPLNKFLGCSETQLPDLDNLPSFKKADASLTWDKLNKIENSAEILLKTLTAMKYASEAKVQNFELNDGMCIPVYNSTIWPFMRKEYDSQTLLDIVQLLNSKDVFALKIDPKTGFALPSGASENNNAAMLGRQCITDIIWAGEIQKRKDPAAWKKAVETLAVFYTNPDEQQAFDEIIADPKSYRDGGLKKGAAHILYTDTLKRDPKHNNKRLESLGLALRAMTSLLFDGFVMHAQSGTVKPSPQLLAAAANIAAYLEAIDYPSALSSGNLEGFPLEEGAAWDTAVINAAMQDLCDFMYSSDYSGLPGVKEIRKKLKEQKHGDIFRSPEKLEKVIKKGTDRLRASYITENSESKDKDAYSAFIFSLGAFSLDNEPIESAQKHLQILKTLEETLVREHGMIRTRPLEGRLKNGERAVFIDNYLNLNSGIACDINGKIDFPWMEAANKLNASDYTDPKVNEAISSMLIPCCEAQWFMVSDLGRSYSALMRQVIRSAEKRAAAEGRNTISRVENQIINEAKSGADRCINRALARITPNTDTIKANGETCPAWSVPEAWQCLKNTEGHPAYLPGINTPNTWAEASLYNLLDTHITNLEYLRDSHLPEPIMQAPANGGK